MTAIVGATGFVGSAVAAAAPTPNIRMISRVPRSVDPRAVAADITDLGTIREALRGCTSVIHCASYVGPSLELNAEMNERGTANLVQAARENGIRRVTYVSTSGVYGLGPHRGTWESAPRYPFSVTSRSRLIAEDLIIASEGIVIRPHLLYGPGDTRVIPVLLHALTTMGGLPDGGANRISLLDVRLFAQQVWAAHSTARTDALPEFQLNADSGTPLPLRAIRDGLESALGAELSYDLIPAELAEKRLGLAGFNRHQTLMCTNDNWFRSKLEDIGSRPPLGPPNTALSLDEESVRWYRDS